MCFIFVFLAELESDMNNVTCLTNQNFNFYFPAGASSLTHTTSRGTKLSCTDIKNYKQHVAKVTLPFERIKNHVE
jgi:hypothetical protein